MVKKEKKGQMELIHFLINSSGPALTVHLVFGIPAKYALNAAE